MWRFCMKRHKMIILGSLIGIGIIMVGFGTSRQVHAQAPSQTERFVLGLNPGGPSGGLSPYATVPPSPHQFNPLDKITPVTDAKLINPPAEDWLTWRRTYDDQGFSPLKQIDKSNVAQLRSRWSWSLFPGAHEAT